MVIGQSSERIVYLTRLVDIMKYINAVEPIGPIAESCTKNFTALKLRITMVKRQSVAFAH